MCIVAAQHLNLISFLICRNCINFTQQFYQIKNTLRPFVPAPVYSNIHLIILMVWFRMGYHPWDERKNAMEIVYLETASDAICRKFNALIIHEELSNMTTVNGFSSVY